MSDNSVVALVADLHYCGIADGRSTRNAGKVDYQVRCYKATPINNPDHRTCRQGLDARLVAPR